MCIDALHCLAWKSGCPAALMTVGAQRKFIKIKMMCYKVLMCCQGVDVSICSVDVLISELSKYRVVQKSKTQSNLTCRPTFTLNFQKVVNFMLRN